MFRTLVLVGLAGIALPVIAPESDGQWGARGCGVGRASSGMASVQFRGRIAGAGMMGAGVQSFGGYGGGMMAQGFAAPGVMARGRVSVRGSACANGACNMQRGTIQMASHEPFQQQFVPRAPITERVIPREPIVIPREPIVERTIPREPIIERIIPQEPLVERFVPREPIFVREPFVIREPFMVPSYEPVGFGTSFQFRGRVGFGVRPFLRPPLVRGRFIIRGGFGGY